MIFIRGLGMCEGVGEDSRHEIGHVGIQVTHVHLGGE